jgi:hypothetical protein
MCFSLWGLRAMFMVLVGIDAISFVIINLSAFVDSNVGGARLLPADSVAVENSAGNRWMILMLLGVHRNFDIG